MINTVPSHFSDLLIWLGVICLPSLCVWLMIPRILDRSRSNRTEAASGYVLAGAPLFLSVFNVIWLLRDFGLVGTLHNLNQIWILNGHAWGAISCVVVLVNLMNIPISGWLIWKIHDHEINTPFRKAYDLSR